ncbi:lipopolysaccharide biosynthesis protein [Mesoflavibacter zeaxanthinifaciens]|uniref:lipopolysaccharide biosynthesis protein n=1 Tax=Mesoflavibacter zeaxanthinifaciens TaxID=393060 RepID=UPI003A8E3DE8
MEIKSPSNLSIKKRLSFLMKDTALYGGAAAFSKAFALITFPVLARYFSVEDYGLIDYFNVLSALAGTFFIFGQDSAVARYFYEYEDTEKRRQVISQSVFFQLGMLLILIPLLWASIDLIAPQLSNSVNTVVLLKLILLRVPFMVMINFSQNLLKWTFNRMRFLIISIGSVIMNVGLILIAIFYFEIDVTGVFMVSLISSVIFGLLGIWFIRKWLIIPVKFYYLKRLLKYGLPLGFIGIMASFVPAVERNIVTKMLGSYDLGLYAAGTKIALLVMLVVQAFQMSWGPFSLAIYKQPDAASTYNWVLKIFTIVMCVFVLILSSIANPVIVFLASEDYSGASIVVFPIAMGLVIKAISWITEVGISLSKKSYLNFYGQLAYFIVTILAIYVLAPVLGLLGIAFGVMIGHIVNAIIASSLAQRAYTLPWAYKSTFFIVLITTILGVFGVYKFVDFTTFSIYYYILSILIILSLGWILLLNKTERIKFINILSFKNQSLRK